MIYHKIVTQGSATLDPKEPATMVMGADHHSICKFGSNEGAFLFVNAALNAVLAKLNGQDTRNKIEDERV